MGLFSGISDALNIATKLVSFTNPAMLGAQLFMGAASNLGDQLIQKLGDSFGLPQSMIDAAQGAFHQSFGDVDGAMQNFGEAFEGLMSGLSATDQAAVNQTMEQGIGGIADFVTNQIRQEGANSEEAGEGKGSWLVAMARVLGKACQDKADALVAKAENLDNSNTKQVAEFQAMSQEFSMMMNATTSAIKAIGEGLASTARK